MALFGVSPHLQLGLFEAFTGTLENSVLSMFVRRFAAPLALGLAN